MLSLVTPAVAVAPLALTAAEMLLTPIIFGGASWLLPKSATVNVPKTGTATPTGIQRNMLAKLGPAAALAVVGYMEYQDLFGVVPADPSNNPYPALHGALYKSTAQPFNGNNLSVGSVVIYDGTARQITSVLYLDAYSNATCLPSGASNSGTTLYYASVSGETSGSTCPGGLVGKKAYIDAYTFKNVPMPPFTPAPGNEIASKLGLSELYPTVLPDIDKLIAARPDLVQLPSTLANDILSAKKQLASDAISSANATKVQSLADIVASKQAAYDANPTQENLDALNKAKADLAESEAVVATRELEKAEEEEKTLEDKFEDDSVLTPPRPPEMAEINYQPLVDMGQDLGNKFPFSLLATLKNFALGLVAEPKTPVFEITFPAPFDYTWTFDLSRFDGIAQFVRVLIGMAFLAYCTMSLIRRWQ